MAGTSQDSLNSTILLTKLLKTIVFSVTALSFTIFLKSIKGLKEYTEYFISKKVSGKGSKLERAGLISMSDKERAAVLANFKAGKAVK